MAVSGFEVDGGAAGHEAALAVVVLAFADAVVRAADLRAGESVLDLACGTGFVARRVAPVVGPTGRVVGVDGSPALLAVGAGAGPPGIEWVEAPMGALPFPDATFDAVLCLHGVAAFADRAGALAEVRRVLRPEGRAVLSVWAAPHCPYLLAEAAALEAEIGAVAAAPVWDLLPSRGDLLLQRLLAGAGFATVAIHEVGATAELPDLEAYVPAHLAATSRAGAFAALDAGGRHRVVDGVASRLAEHGARDGRLHVPFSAYVAVARG